jgi:hypothetical protein
VYVKVDRVRSGKKVYSYLILAESYRNESGQPRIEAVMALDLARAKISDPDLDGQALSARRALRELERIRMIRFVDGNDNERQVITRPSHFQAKILAAFGVDTSAWRSRVT